MLVTESAGRRPGNFVAHLRDLALRRPDDLWLTVADDVGGTYAELPISYAVFERRVRALAAVLQQGFAPGERALVMLDNGDHYAVCMLACFYSGVIAVPIFPPESMRPQHLARLMGVAADAQARCVLTSAALAGAIADSGVAFEGAQTIAVDAIDIAQADGWQPWEPAGEDIAFLQYTSGSTSAPKGVIVTHACLMANELAMADRFAIRTDSRFVTWAPLYHDMGLICGLLLPLYCGIEVVLTSPRYFLERPMRWLELISRHRATHSGGPDFAFRLCLERVRDAQIATLDLSAWECAYTGAEPVRADTEQDFLARFAPTGLHAGAAFPCYGLAEATLFVTAAPQGQGMTVRGFNAEALAAGRGVPDAAGPLFVSCGTAPAGHALAIVDPQTLADVAPGVIGEIWFSGPSVAAGYWRNEEATRRTFVERGGLRWLRTGDLGFLCDAGELYVTGRIKDLIIVRGHNIYPQDVERTIEAEVDAVRKSRVAVFAVQGPDGEGIGVAAEVSRSMQKLVPPAVLVEALSAAVSESLGEPLSVVVLLNPGGLPKTTSGKLQRSACRTGWLDRSADAYAIYEFGAFVRGGPAAQTPAAAVAPADETERELDAIWRNVLRRSGDQPLPRDAHFFTSGGNSLSATQAAARIAARWRIAFPVRLMFEHPRLQDCAALIRDRLAQGTEAAPAAMPVLAAEARSTGLPLSHAQERQWFLWRMDPAGTAYHVCAALRIGGPLDGDALQATLVGLRARHASLRTRFSADAQGTARQWIGADAHLPLAVTDLRRLPAAEREKSVDQALRDVAARPFDLAHGDLVRAAWLRLTGNDQVLVLAMHHIVTDGVSMQVLMDELAAGYAARQGGQAAMPWAPLPVEYTDYAAWQRDWLAAGEGARQLAWWREQLGDAHPRLEWPTDRPRPPQGERLRAARHGFALPAPLLADLRRTAAEAGTTLFVTLLAGLQTLLHRLTGQGDIRIGTAMANRHRAEVERVVGLFVNTLVLPGRLDGRMPLRDVLAQAREMVLGAQAHQDLPFDQLVQALQPERGAGENPLFQVMLNHLIEDHSAFGAIGGLEVRHQPMPDLQAQFELVLEARESLDGGLRLDLIYAADLFTPEAMERLSGHYTAILQALATTPERAVGDVALLSASEQAQLASWSLNPEREPDFEPIHRQIARQNPQATALLFADEVWTYGQLNRRSSQLAHRLRRQGVGPDTLVGIAMQRSPELIVGILAILKAGGAYLP
ncbi:condensation domain-containing protein, partial [Paracidovorax wautersii]|uniref:condensation domain-containing protein n=1 Tax=Paracidovorax wautersii TaxID=1177982 RepID=UPI0031D70720